MAQAGSSAVAADYGQALAAAISFAFTVPTGADLWAELQTIMATQVVVSANANSSGDAVYRITGASVTLTFATSDITDATFMCAVKNESATTATLATQGSETIEGLTSMPFFGPGASIWLYSDGTNLRQL